jgi:hypothetical protein
LRLDFAARLARRAEKPHAAVATALSGVGKVVMFGASAGAATDQIRMVAS